MTRWALIILAFFVVATPIADAQSAKGAEAPELTAELLDAASRIPVLDQGRIKPLSTVAAFTLLGIHHKRTFKDAEGVKHKALPWLLHTMLAPEQARGQAIFLVANHDALDAIGLERSEGKKRRDRYSYNDLLPARMKLAQLAHDYARIESKDRSPVQNQVVMLAQAVGHFEAYARYLDFARVGVPVPEALRSRFGGQKFVRVSEALAGMKKIKAAGAGADIAEARKLERAAHRALSGANALAIFPPLEEKHGKTWLKPADLLMTQLDDRHIGILASIENWVVSADSPVQLQGAVQSTLDRTRTEAEARGEYGKIGLEIFYYKLDSFYRALVLFIFSFLLVAGSWLKPTWKWLTRGVWGTAWLGLAFVAVGITLRCILRSRPPVSTLYETVVFITGIAVLAALVMEIINKRRIGLAAAPCLGVLGMFLAMRFEEIKGEDTMPQLVAVLDTNFWLATHVTCITIGYAAGLLAAAIAHVNVLGRVFGLKSGDVGFYAGVNRMVYGVLAFSLIFSVVGTILGGVWANDSWGRFWGWDPKENGALLICLSQIAILHARMGGLLKANGIALAVIFQGMVVAFSWWGVNLLGIGLHSYGFTDGIWRGLITFWGIEGGVIALGAIAFFRGR